MSTYLCIGGPAHGTLRALQEGIHHYHVAIPETDIAAAFCEASTDPSSFITANVTVYTVRKAVFLGHLVTVLVHEDVDEDEASRLMVKHAINSLGGGDPIVSE